MRSYAHYYTSGNRVYVNSVTRVQIPNSPPKPFETAVSKGFAYFNDSFQNSKIVAEK